MYLLYHVSSIFRRADDTRLGDKDVECVQTGGVDSALHLSHSHRNWAVGGRIPHW